MTGLNLKAVSIKLGERELLSINEQVASGEVLTIMGPSGVGKSTLLSYVAGMLPENFTASGEVWLSNQRIDHKPAWQRKTGLLFQDALLFNHLNVADNIAFAMPEQGLSRSDKKAKIEQALAQMSLIDLADAPVQQLSGGQQARVALLRVLFSQPNAILLDEAFSKLDSQLRQSIRELVFFEIRQRKLPALMVTHDIEDAKVAGGPVIEVNTLC
ncbi:ATP-binding cassette domain-containing protein [Catenovulum adriaticum]|uniref:ATP-binding cassette domain-containing protein n=1 Tax=Catenovulum adriaticum TaxID=2984846 RepID=A0ABY7AQ58_9ALTE|nr:ATP-binding cassette domain-containing protein [Catenovulum sp. TS8]WAJ71688.1 ATP-binding cassette domain-containing protein [Catenovulum sp. TS8]